MVTTIILTNEMQALKKEIEQTLDGAKLSHGAVYRRGLCAYKELMEMKKIKVNLVDTTSSS